MWFMCRLGHRGEKPRDCGTSDGICVVLYVCDWDDGVQQVDAPFFGSELEWRIQSSRAQSPFTSECFLHQCQSRRRLGR